MPLASRLAQSGQKLDVVTANVEVAHWLAEVANTRVHGTTKEPPAEALKSKAVHLQALPAPWRADITAARPQAAAACRPTTGGAGELDRADVAAAASFAAVRHVALNGWLKEQRHEPAA